MIFKRDFGTSQSWEKFQTLCHQCLDVIEMRKNPETEKWLPFKLFTNELHFPHCTPGKSPLTIKCPKCHFVFNPKKGQRRRKTVEGLMPLDKFMPSKKPLDEWIDPTIAIKLQKHFKKEVKQPNE